MNIIPIIIVGGAIAFAMKKKKKSRTAKNGAKPNDKKALPSGRGTMFHEKDLPDLIKANVGERFSIVFPGLGASTGHQRWLAASPPDNSVEHVDTQQDIIQKVGEDEMGGDKVEEVYIFKAAKKGAGSLVFHVQQPWLKGKEPPDEIIEIQTEIS